MHSYSYAVTKASYLASNGWEHSGTRGTDSAETYCAMTGWWFGTMEFYNFPYIGKNNPYFSIFSIHLEHVSIFWN